MCDCFSTSLPSSSCAMQVRFLSRADWTIRPVSQPIVPETLILRRPLRSSCFKQDEGGRQGRISAWRRHVIRTFFQHQTGTPLRPAARQFLVLCATQRPKTPRCPDSWMDSLRSACQTSPSRGDWIPSRFFGSLFMKLFLPAVANQEQHNFGPIPHLFPWPSMTAVCGLARRAQACTWETQHLGHFTGLPMCSFSFPLKQRIVSNWE